MNGLGDWLTYIVVPSILGTFAVTGSGLLISFLVSRIVFKIFSRNSQSASFYYGYFWTGSMLAILGFSISELGYQLNFWDAPGIWGAPGKHSTVWGPLQYALPPLGFALGAALNAMLEQHIQKKAHAVRIIITFVVSLLLLATYILGAKHGWETMG